MMLKRCAWLATSETELVNQRISVQAKLNLTSLFALNATD